MPGHCYVTGCNTGYPSSEKKGLSLFQPPADEAKLEDWRRRCPRKDRVLQHKDRICELHFAPHFIERDYVHVVNGTEVRIPKGRPTLRNDAFPSIFPGLPKYLSKQIKERKCPANRNYNNEKKRKYSEEPNSCNVTEFSPTSVNNDAAPITADSETFYKRETLNSTWTYFLQSHLPDGWGRRADVNHEKVTFFHCSFVSDGTQNPAKVIEVTWTANKPVPTVFVHGNEVVNVLTLIPYNHTPEHIPNFLHELLNYPFCEGLNLQFVKVSIRLTPSMLKKLVIRNSRMYSVQCVGLSKGCCWHCTKLKKNFYHLTSQTLTTIKQKRSQYQHLRNTLKREAKLKIDIKVMKHANQRRKEDVIKEAVDGLPLKQKIAVMQCFKKCKKKGERYTKEWVLECLLMRIKSRALSLPPPQKAKAPGLRELVTSPYPVIAL